MGSVGKTLQWSELVLFKAGGFPTLDSNRARRKYGTEGALALVGRARSNDPILRCISWSPGGDGGFRDSMRSRDSVLGGCSTKSATSLSRHVPEDVGLVSYWDLWDQWQSLMLRRISLLAVNQHALHYFARALLSREANMFGHAQHPSTKGRSSISCVALTMY